MLKSKPWSDDHPWWDATPTHYRMVCKVEGIRGVQRIPHFDVRPLDGPFGQPASRKVTLPTSTQLTNELIDAHVVIGDILEIEWVGWKLTEGRGHHAMKFYKVKVAGKYDNSNRIPSGLFPRESWDRGNDETAGRENVGGNRVNENKTAGHSAANGDVANGGRRSDMSGG